MESIGVVVATFGDHTAWAGRIAHAVASAENQVVHPQEVIALHGETLAEARNAGADALSTDWLIFLDADDELDSLYVSAMAKGTGDVRQPSTLGVVNGRPDDFPVLIAPRPNFLQGNHLVIGSMIRHSLFNSVGGFREMPILEDWDLWLRCWLQHAVITACPEAIYIVHVSTDSRNNMYELHGQLYGEIQAEYTAEARAKGLL